MSETRPPLPFGPEATGSTQSVGESIDDGKGRIFPCEGCGADLQFHIGEQQLKCPFCGFQKELVVSEDAEVAEQDFHGMLARVAELHTKTEAAAEQQNEVRCSACGGTVVFAGTLTSSECAYCGSPIQRDDVHLAADRISVDGVLPFLVEKDAASVNLVKWVSSRWFAPNAFRKRGVEGKFNGVYLPFWTFDSLTMTAYSGQRGKHYWVTVGSGKNRRRVRRTRWYPASGRFQRFFDDVLVLAAQGMRRELMLKLEPWPLGKCIPFTPQVLAGYLARTYDVELHDGFREAKQRIDGALEQDVRHRIGGDTQRVHSIRTDYGALTFKHLLLPTWLLAYRFNQKSYQVMVNAATGEVQGDRPYSWVKITAAVLTGLAVAGGIAAIIAST